MAGPLGRAIQLALEKERQGCHRNPSGYTVGGRVHHEPGNHRRLMTEPPESAEETEENAANDALTPAMQLLELQKQHRLLDGKIAELHSFPYQNQVLLQRLKKEKLRLKDTITRLKDEMIPDLNA